ncbi:MAG: UDP-2,3-diacylglucosamine diphosphatase LpxI, partial [Candidatus Firestonebacteria bacterium]|nr:UDP-2,3-diacylglucosamine diphosphatase LpxI [Candidatus Firestonebacteria bacterium]
MTIIKEKIGLIAANGTLPLVFIQEASHKNFSIIAIALTRDSAKQIKKQGLAEKIHRINLTEIDLIIRTLIIEKVKKVVMLGKVNKIDIFFGLKFDKRTQELLKKKTDFKDSSFMQLAIQELESEGLTVLKQTEFLSSLLVQPGVLTIRKPGQEEIADIQYGLEAAKEIARMDIGQTIVVKNRTVIAVEALEGTDAAILRAGKLIREGGIVVKVSRPKQDLRYDIPAIGLNTLKSMKKSKINILAIEANKTLLLD